MKKLLIIIIGFMLCSWMTSCYTTQLVPVSNQEMKEINEMWQGQTKKAIIYKFGPPTREMSDGADGSILIYEYDLGSTTTTTSKYYENSNTKKENTNTYYKSEYTWFYLDSDNICNGVKSNHFKKSERVLNDGLTIGVVMSSVLFGGGLIGAIISTILE